MTAVMNCGHVAPLHSDTCRKRLVVSDDKRICAIACWEPSAWIGSRAMHSARITGSGQSAR
ncbi:hypothetical protein AWB81_06345 [Caballeronia arationis]|nr:hypothetical protein AWB81_06345 [Caballeronia arationis]